MFKNILLGVFVTLIACSSLFADEISQNLSRELDGKTIAWEYDGGRNYELRVANGEITYRRTNGTNAREWRSLVPYTAHKIREGEFMIGWHEIDYSNYVTLLIDFNESKLYSSALLGNYDMIHFQEAKITDVTQE
jgi:phenolic acid decarboxylase